MHAFVARFLDRLAGLMKGNIHYEAWLIKMALKSPTHETCSCVSPDAFEDLSSKKRQGVHMSLVRTPN